jgi:cyclophilin family peptidyl-prolyl cis-trans isomerase
MNNLALSLLFAAVTVESPAAAADVQNPRILFRTVAGDLVFELNPKIAPRHVQKICELTAAGMYHGTHFHRLEPGFVLQHAGCEDRPNPLSAGQRELIEKMRAERSTALHVKGALSLAREDGDPHSGTTSFSILLGNAPHLDGNYTIFGALTHGWEVIDNFHKVPRNGSTPRVRLTVTEAWVIPPGEKLPPLRIANIDAMAAAEGGSPAGAFAAVASDRLLVAAAIVLGIVVLGVAQTFLHGTLAPARLRSLTLLMVFLGAFLFLILTIPVSHLYSAIGIGSFVGLLGLFKLLGQFETPVA